MTHRQEWQAPPWIPTLWCGRLLSLDPTTRHGRVEPSNWCSSLRKIILTRRHRFDFWQKCSIRTSTTMVRSVWISYKTSGRPFMTYRLYWPVFNRCCAIQIPPHQPIRRLVGCTTKTGVNTTDEFERLWNNRGKTMRKWGARRGKNTTTDVRKSRSDVERKYSEKRIFSCTLHLQPLMHMERQWTLILCFEIPYSWAENYTMCHPKCSRETESVWKQGTIERMRNE